LNVGYYRRWFGNFTVTDNVLVTPADYDSYCITVPVDSRLPSGGGETVCGYSDVSIAKRGQVQNLITNMSNFGDRKQIRSGFDVTVAARLQSGTQVSGGSVTEKAYNWQCFPVDAPTGPVAANASPDPFCEEDGPWVTSVKFVFVQPLPWDTQVSGSYQNIPGVELSATDVVYSSAQIRSSLGRDLSSGANGTVTLKVMPQGTWYAKHFNRVDLRASKIFRLGANRRLTASVDAFNLFNGAGVVNVVTRYGPSWLNPTQIIGARATRLAVRFDF
jgi:hypothetical protein